MKILTPNSLNSLKKSNSNTQTKEKFQSPISKQNIEPYNDSTHSSVLSENCSIDYSLISDGFQQDENPSASKLFQNGLSSTREQFLVAVDKQISILKLAASRYCRTARLLLTEQLKSQTDTSIEDIKSNIENVLNSVHIVIDFLEDRRRLAKQNKIEEEIYFQMDEILVNRWKENGRPFSCKNVSESELTIIQWMIYEEDRLRELRGRIWRGLCRFARAVRLGRFPLSLVPVKVVDDVEDNNLYFNEDIIDSESLKEQAIDSVEILF